MTTQTPEYIKAVHVSKFFPFSHSQVYQLLSRGVIKSHSIRLPGSKKGTRLVSVESIRQFIESCPSK